MLMRGQPNPLCPLFTERESGDISRVFLVMLHWASAFNVVQLHVSILEREEQQCHVPYPDEVEDSSFGEEGRNEIN